MNDHKRPPKVDPAFLSGSASQDSDPDGSRNGISNNKRRWDLKLLLVVVAGLSIVVFAVFCGGCVMFFGLGLSEVESETRKQLAQTPEIQEYIGEIEALDTDWSRTLDLGGEETTVYRIRGRKKDSSGNEVPTEGFAVVRLREDGSYDEIVQADLILSDGKKVPVRIGDK